MWKGHGARCGTQICNLKGPKRKGQDSSIETVTINPRFEGRACNARIIDNGTMWSQSESGAFFFFFF